MAIEKYVVSNDKSIYEAWPDVVLTDSGKLICVFSECEHHVDRTNARLVLCESTDRGRTWSEKKPLTEKGTATDFFNCARISKLNDGTLAIICDKLQGALGTHSERNAVQYLWFGDKEGTTWSEPLILPFKGIVPDKLTQLKCGRLLIGAHFKNFETDKLEQYLWYSDDNGKTWSDRVTIGADPRYNLCEVSILECEDGTLVAFMRENSFQGYDMMKSISYDKGETWEGVYNTPMSGGHRPTTGFLNDGSVMVTYRFHFKHPEGMANMFGAILSADTLTKSVRAEQDARIFPIDYDRNTSPDGGYTGWVQFDDGEIYVVNYIKDDADKAQIRGYSFKKEDIILS